MEITRNISPLVFHIKILGLLVFLQGCGGGGGGSDESIAPEPRPPAQVTVSRAVQQSANEAFVYGYPLTEMMKACDRHPTINQLTHRGTLATPDNRNVVRPNNDTLYTSACVYLGESWVLVTLPASPDRYLSMQIIDGYTETAAVRGPNEVPDIGGQYVLQYSGASNNANLPAGVPVIEVATPYSFAIFRALVDGPADLANATTVQQSILLEESVSSNPDRSIPSGTSSAQGFFLQLMRRLEQNPPPLLEENLVSSFSVAGVQASGTPALVGVSGEQLAAWEIAYTEGLERLENTRLGMILGGWSFISANAANPGDDYEFRATIARKAIFPAPLSEAKYGSTRGDGLQGYILDLPIDWPPVNFRGFWSLTLYDAQGFLVENDIDRYSIGDRTPGIQFEQDGSLKIYIQCEDPGGALTANWLPAPCGQFTMTMRIYLPNASAQSPNFMLPPVL